MYSEGMLLIKGVRAHCSPSEVDLVTPYMFSSHL